MKNKPNRHNSVKSQKGDKAGKNRKREKLSTKMARALEVPAKIAEDTPLLSMVGDREILVENYKGIVEYSEEKVRLRLKNSQLLVEGRGLQLSYITAESLKVAGRIEKIQFFGGK